MRAMQHAVEQGEPRAQFEHRPARSEFEQWTLKQWVDEASQALTRLDAARLEELALSCQDLSRNCLNQDSLILDRNGTLIEARSRLACEAREA